MSGFVASCVDTYLGLGGRDWSSFSTVATPSVDEASFTEVDLEGKGVLALVAACVVIKSMYCARRTRWDLLHDT